MHVFDSRRIWLFSCFLLAVIASGTIRAQNIFFRHLTIDDGLSQNAVLSIMQDRKGFMWFGTKDGLNRYDGYTFTVYRHNPFDSTSVSSSYITALFEDSRGAIWVGTFHGGINLFQRDNQQFRHITFRSTNLGTCKVEAIAEDSAGFVWIGTEGDGVFRLSMNQQTSTAVRCEQFVFDQRRAGSLSSNSVTSVFVDSKGIVWIGSEKGLDKFRPGDGTFQHFDIRTKHKSAPSIREKNEARRGRGLLDIT